MSAYVCNPEHFGALAAFACTRFSPYPGGGRNCCLPEFVDAMNDPVQSARNVARALAAENIRSVQCRYPTAQDDYSDVADACADFAARFMRRRPELSLLSILNMCMCLDYQSCETKEWPDTLAYRQVQWIMQEAIQRMPGFDESIRDYMVSS